jgi:hypothetical protein
MARQPAHRLHYMVGAWTVFIPPMMMQFLVRLANLLDALLHVPSLLARLTLVTAILALGLK